MLILSRKSGERIVIGTDIEVVVMDTRGDRVRIGIDAPQEVPVHRNEVHERIQRQQRMEPKLTTSEECEQPFYVI